MFEIFEIINGFFLFQGYHIDTSPPLEAVMVLHQCERRLGHPIPEEDLKVGRLD